MTHPERLLAYRPARRDPCARATLEVVLVCVSAGIRVTAWIVLTYGKRCRHRS